MRKLIVGAFISLDGIMQAPGGPQEDPVGGFRFGGWVAPHFDEATGSSVAELFGQPFDLVLGRKTYDIFAAHWPYAPAGDPIGTLFNRINKYVATRNPAFPASWENSHLLGADVVAAVRALKAGDGPNLLTQGSTEFLKTLLAHGLVDEFYLSIFPVMLGRGKRLFGEDTQPAALTLLSSRTTGTGVTVNRYAPAGEVVTGSFAFAEPSAAEVARRSRLT